MSASVWNPSSSGTSVNADKTLKMESFTATAGQTDFVLSSFSFTPATGSTLLVYNGALRRVGYDFVELSSTTLRTLFPCNEGDEILIFGFAGLSTEVITSRQIKNYQVAIAGQTQVSTGAVYSVGTSSTQVFKNGLALNPTEYTEVTGANYVVLTTPASAGDKFITIIGQTVGTSFDTDATKVSYMRQSPLAQEIPAAAIFDKYVTTTQWGIPVDGTDPAGNNHLKLKEAAKEAIRNHCPLIIIGYVGVSANVDLDTSGSYYNDTSPFHPNSFAKPLDVLGYGSSCIVGLGSFFTDSGSSTNYKDVVTLRTQTLCEFTAGVRTLKDSPSVTYANLKRCVGLHVKGSDRIQINTAALGGLVNGSSVDVGHGVALWLEDVMSPRVEACDIQYFTKYGICIDGGWASNPMPTTEAIRVSTSGVISRCHISGGNPDAVSRNECIGINAGYGYIVRDNIFEFYSKGRAVVAYNDGVTFEGNWCEGIYDTYLLAAGFGHIINESDEIRFSPTSGRIEGVSPYVIGGALALGTSDTNSVDSTFFNCPGFYHPIFRIPCSTTIRGNLTLTGSGNITGTYFKFSESNADVSGVIGANAGQVFNDQAVMQVHSPIAGVSRLRLTSGGVASDTNNFMAEVVSAPSDANTGMWLNVNQNKRITVQVQGTDAFYLANSSFGRYFLPSTDNNVKLGDPGGFRWSQLAAGTATITTSDARYKTAPKQFTDTELDAWELVDWVKYQLIESVEAKKADGRIARYHAGVIAQQVKEAFESKGLDPFAIGILCYDTWEDEYVDEVEVVEKTLEDGTVKTYHVPTGNMIQVRKAGNVYSIRYEEAYAIQTACFKRHNLRQEARIAKLEAAIAKLGGI